MKLKLKILTPNNQKKILFIKQVNIVYNKK